MSYPIWCNSYYYDGNKFVYRDASRLRKPKDLNVDKWDVYRTDTSRCVGLWALGGITFGEIDIDSIDSRLGISLLQVLKIMVLVVNKVIEIK